MDGEAVVGPGLGDLFAALAKAQGEMKPAKKDSQNPFFKSSYADLAAVWEACRVPLSKNGLAVAQWVDGEVLVTTLGHSSGQHIESRLLITAKKEGDAQALGSALTYLRRYALAALVGVSAEGEDDDGEGTSGRGEEKRPAPPSRPAPAPKPPVKIDGGRVPACPNCQSIPSVMRSDDAEKGAWRCNPARGGCGFYFA